MERRDEQVDRRRRERVDDRGHQNREHAQGYQGHAEGAEVVPRGFERHAEGGAASALPLVLRDEREPDRVVNRLQKGVAQHQPALLRWRETGCQPLCRRRDVEVEPNGRAQALRNASAEEVEDQSPKRDPCER